MSDKTQKKILQARSTTCLSPWKSAYPHKRRNEPSEFLDYSAAKQYLRSLLASTRWAIKRAIRTRWTAVFEFRAAASSSCSSTCTETDSDSRRRQPGGQRVYDSLYDYLRALYIQFGQDQAAAAAPGAPPPEN